jgi:hypothetical protein
MKEIQLRRWQNMLTISGMGVIVFGAWSVLKTILLLVFRQELVSNIPDDIVERVILYVLVGVLLLIDFSVRLFVGLSARAEGFGKKKGWAYLVIAVLIALSSVSSLVTVFFGTGNTPILELIVSTIVEITSLAAVIEMLAAAVMVRKLRKELGEGQ